MTFGPWLAFIILGAILLAVGYNVTMPTPLNSICRCVGWILVGLGALLLILSVLGLTGLILGPGFDLVILGLILVVIGYNIVLPVPFNRLCIWIGWLIFILGIIVVLWSTLGHGSVVIGSGPTSLIAMMLFNE